MQTFVRGQRAKISQFHNGAAFEARIVLQSARVAVFDFVCFGLDEREQLRDDRFMVFFNQKIAPGNAVALAQLGDREAAFSVDLAALPPAISRLVFTVSIDGEGAMRDLQSGIFTLRDAKSAQDILEYRFSGADFEKEGALMLTAIYRKDGAWRFWAQGQGFEGNLGALLQHFGGEEIEAAENESSTRLPTPVVAAPTVQSSPPLSAPAAASTSVFAPPVPASAGSLQQMLARATAGSTITLPRGEHQGPIYLDKPLVVNGEGAVVWAQNGPVVVVQSAGVTLRDMEIEVTAPDKNVLNSNVALWVAPDVGTQLHNVRARGEIIGVSEAEGEWELPPFLDLGEFAPRIENSFQMEIETPHSCQIKSNVLGVSVHPSQLPAGRQNVEIRVANVAANTLLSGTLELSTGGIARTISLSGRAAAAPREAIHDLQLWSVSIVGE